MGQLISQELFDTLVLNYEELHGEEPSFTRYSTISFASLGITHPTPEAVAFRAYNGFDGSQTKTLLVLVDAEGNELDPFEEEGEETEAAARTPKNKAVQDDGPTCPPSCR